MVAIRRVMPGLLTAAFLALAPHPTQAQPHPAPAQPHPTPVITLHEAGAGRAHADAASLLTRAHAEGRLAVIVGFDAGQARAGDLTPQAALAQDRQLGAERDRLLQAAGIQGARSYGGLPFFSLDATPDQLRRLLQTAGVSSIAEPATGYAHVSLNYTTEVIRADAAWEQGFEGNGWTVAIIDTGVANHAALRDRIVGEYCASGDPRICTQGSTAPGAGRNCGARIARCEHGTHVAGIAAMRNARSQGVAPVAGILAIQAFRRTNACPAGTNPPCASWDERDLLDALAHVRTLTLAGSLSIASVNMSLGDSSAPYVGPCDSHYTALTHAVAELTALGIAVVTATGNAGQAHVTHFPSCISEAIAVGATWAEDGQVEAVTVYSDNGPAVDLLAPGHDIASTIPSRFACARSASGGLCRLNGTSMAAPHVAGAFALLRSMYPDESLRRLRSALVCTGRRIAIRYTDRPGTTAEPVRARPRIDVGAALDWLADPDARDCTTHTGLESAGGSSLIGQEIDLVASVSATEGQLLGHVEFFDGPSLLGRAPLESIAEDPVVEVAAGDWHSCARLQSGRVACWGWNDYGQLGDGTTTQRLTPVLVQGLTDATQIVAGGTHNCALRRSGGIACWGSNNVGQLGDGTDYVMRSVPVAVRGIHDATQIAVSELHSCALRRNGHIACWGWNYYGQLGNMGVYPSPIPVPVLGIRNATAVATGDYHTCALRSNGRVACWGWNEYGQLGDGTTTVQRSPVTVVGVHNATRIALSFAHSCALRLTGRIACWGDNSEGQIGDGTLTPRLTAVPVQGISDAQDIAAGNQHNCALRPSGRLACWGWNGYGQLGDGTTTSRATPVAVSGLNNAARITAGWYQSCALRLNGRIACWGGNEYGTIGDGTTTRRLTPVAVAQIPAPLSRAVLRYTALLPGTRRLSAAYSGSADHAASVTSLEHQVTPR